MHPTAEARFQRILVTGGAGFLGSHLCRRLVNEGHEVICLDNFFTSPGRLNVADLLTKPNFELVRHDVTEPFVAEVDQIYNLACPASPVHYQYNPVKTMKTSFLGAYNMLGLAKRIKARILQASTSEVYGDPDISPQPESYWGHVNCIGVRSCYDEGKRAAETLFFDYHRSNGVDIRVVRIFNTYGPGMNPYDGRVVSNFIVQALNNEDITIYGDGSQTRSFCFVHDLVDAMVRMMNQDAYVGPVNIGNPNEFTIKQLAEKVVELTKSKSKIIYLPLPSDDPKQRRPDITLAKKYIHWEPKVQLKEGLEATIEYFQALDMRHFKKPTPHTAHKNTEMVQALASPNGKIAAASASADASASSAAVTTTTTATTEEEEEEEAKKGSKKKKQEEEGGDEKKGGTAKKTTKKRDSSDEPEEGEEKKKKKKRNTRE